ncbi:AAA family ATPase [Agreia sp. Leaf283]|uniref:AAA family ATPase n=1 Tax=Agreia sp. Leaf283 TaxID=1736321 RepID=UPI000A857444|nr:AAA family ATPase [Agreia sp. Leaf283]
MAYIESFTIYGLAGRIRPISRRLDRNLNVFWGLNGSGKTSLLKILHSALENDTSSLSRVPFQSAQVLIRSGGNLVSRTVIGPEQDENDRDSEPTAFEFVDSWRPRTTPPKSWQTETLDGDLDRDYDTMRFTHAYLPISRVSQSRTPGLMNGRTNIERQAIDDAAFDEIFADQVRRRWQTYSNNALLRIREIQQRGLAEILAILFGGGVAAPGESTTSIGSDSAYLLVKAFLRSQRIILRVSRAEFISRYEKEVALQEVVTNIQEVTQEVDLAQRPQTEFQSIIEEFYAGDKHVVFSGKAPSARNSIQIEIGGSSIPLQSLSSGEKQLLQLLLEILAANAHTVMIDEPELSMHVDWQERLVASMQRVNPGCQLLLATHSPEIIAEVHEENVFEL